MKKKSLDLDLKKLFQDFNSREKDLSGIIRFSGYVPMYYRSDLAIHSKHVAWIVREIAEYAVKLYPSFDVQRAVLMALVHDDAEIVFGDVMMGNKLRMTKGQLEELKKQEYQATEEIVARFPKHLGEHVYGDLLKEYMNLQTIESKVVKFSDKFDAFGESLHEVFGGNMRFVTPLTTEYGVIATPPESYVDYFQSFLELFPEMGRFYSSGLACFAPYDKKDFRSIASSCVPFTEHSIIQRTASAQYDWWRDVILMYGEDGERERLWKQTEFVPEDGDVMKFNI